MRILELEIKRVLTTKLTWILLTAAFALSVLLAYVPVIFESVTYTGEQGEEIQLKGVEAVNYLREIRTDMAGDVTPEKVETVMKAFQECLAQYGAEDMYDLPDEANLEGLLPYWDYIDRIREMYSDTETGMSPPISEMDLSETERLYDKVMERTESLMKMEQPDYMSAQEAAMKMYSNVEKPFQYYSGISSNSMDYQVLLIYIILILCVVIAAPIFTSDYQTGADDILRCTKHGRGKLAAAKIISALLICGGTFLICQVIWIVITNSLFGWESTKTSLQFLYSISSLPNLNIGEVQLLNTGAGFLMFLAMVSCALYLSTKMGSTVSSLALALFFCFLPMLVISAAPQKLGLWLQCLLPGGGIGLQNSFLFSLIDFKFLHLGNVSVWTPYAMIFFALIQIPLFLGLAVRSHCKMRG